MNEQKSCITINCGCCNGNTPNGGGVPVGHILAYMGTKAPMHYLICDGAELNIADYPNLTAQILDEFGSVNYFGGDGTTTFAVPDLRNEFLRGFHGGASDQLSGDVGVHQEATEIPSFFKGLDGRFGYKGQAQATRIVPKNVDTAADDATLSKNMCVIAGEGNAEIPGVMGISYTARPANTAVLYCIKYE